MDINYFIGEINKTDNLYAYYLDETKKVTKENLFIVKVAKRSEIVRARVCLEGDNYVFFDQSKVKDREGLDKIFENSKIFCSSRDRNEAPIFAFKDKDFSKKLTIEVIKPVGERGVKVALIGDNYHILRGNLITGSFLDNLRDCEIFCENKDKEFINRIKKYRRFVKDLKNEMVKGLRDLEDAFAGTEDEKYIAEGIKEIGDKYLEVIRLNEEIKRIKE